MDKDLKDRQEVREYRQYNAGIARFNKESDARPMGEQATGKGLVKAATLALIPYVREKVRLLEDGEEHASQVPLAYHYMLGLEVEPMCSITARVVVSAGYKRMKLTRTAMTLANLIEEDFRFDELLQSEPALARSMEIKAKRWPSSGARRRIMRKAAEVAGVKRFGWTDKEKCKLGVKLIEDLSVVTGLVDISMESSGRKTARILTLTPEVMQRIADNKMRIEADNPVNVPMIFPPAPWTSPVSGGYLTQRMQEKMSLVRGIRRETRDDLLSAEMPKVYDAVNRIQATGWQINVPIYRHMLMAYRRRDRLGGMPSQDDEPLPERDSRIRSDVKPDDMPDDMRALFMDWKKRTRDVHEANAKLRSKRLALATKLRIVGDVRKEKVIYFPHSLDFRGRVYAMTAELSPQGDDLAKSMIQFAEGKPLGEHGGFWLAVHTANLFGQDKQSFEDRVQWVMDNTDAIMDSAMKPDDGQRFWCTADDPWCALAACLEWTGFQIEGPDYVSHLPIAMDGSCSGIQHFSALLRDKVGGAAVNLTHTDKPADIYTEVLQATKDLLAKNPDPFAKVWMDRVDRKIVKRPCMTFAYSVTSIGIRDQVAAEMRKQCDGQFLPGHENWKAAAFIAPVIEEAIRTVVKRAAEAMDWLKALAKLVADEDMPMSWVTPLGFPVVHPYRKSKSQMVRVWFKGVRVELSLSVEQQKVNGKKNQLAVAPNFVHSMDATHLMMVANRLKEEGITNSYAMIHDSFGVHAADVDELQFIIRDEFIKLYNQDILTETYQSTLLMLPGAKWPDVPLPPEAGNLDLEEVRDADFFFA